MSRKIDARELLAALGGVVVLVSLFLNWYDGHATYFGHDAAITAWRAFEVLDLLLAALAIAAIATGGRSLGSAVSLGPRALLPLGAALTIIVAVQLISPPPVAWNADLATGAWLGLIGSILVLVGGLLSAASIDVTVNVGPRESRRRVAAVDRRPAPAAATTPADTAPRRSLLDEPDPQATQPFKPVDPEA